MHLCNSKYSQSVSQCANQSACASLQLAVSYSIRQLNYNSHPDKCACAWWAMWHTDSLHVKISTFKWKAYRIEVQWNIDCVSRAARSPHISSHRTFLPALSLLHSDLHFHLLWTLWKYFWKTKDFLWTNSYNIPQHVCICLSVCL